MALQKKDLSFPKDLEKHVVLWVKEGIIDAGQKDRIRTKRP